MSLYMCLNFINQELLNLEKKENSFWRALPFLSELDLKSSKEFLSILKGKLQQRIKNENYENLHNEIDLITARLKQEMPASTRDTMDFIRFDLELIQQKYDSQSKPTPEIIPLNTYLKYQSKDYRIAKIQQGKLPKMGTSPGECFGFTYSMAHPELSPYGKNSFKVDLNQTIHDYQKGQDDRKKDQQTIKRTRRTRVYFCPDPKKQAKKILNEVKKNLLQDKHLSLFKKGAVGSHACYLSLLANGEIRYMDPNVGAFSFKNKDDFIAFYDSRAQLEKAKGADFRFFSLDELRYDENNNSNEVKTWKGMLRTLIMGSKYRDNQFLANRLTMFSYSVLPGIAGAIIGAGLGSVIPGFGTLLGGFIGAAIGAALAVNLCSLAFIQGHFGLLAIPHLLMDQWQNLKEGLSNLLSPQPSYKAPAREAPKQTSDSTKQILFTIRFETANREVQNIGQIEPLERGEEEMNSEQTEPNPNLVSAPEPALDSGTAPPSPRPY